MDSVESFAFNTSKTEPPALNVLAKEEREREREREKQARAERFRGFAQQSRAPTIAPLASSTLPSSRGYKANESQRGKRNHSVTYSVTLAMVNGKRRDRSSDQGAWKCLCTTGTHTHTKRENRAVSHRIHLDVLTHSSVAFP